MTLPSCGYLSGSKVKSVYLGVVRPLQYDLHINAVLDMLNKNKKGDLYKPFHVERLVEIYKKHYNIKDDLKAAKMLRENFEKRKQF